VGTVGFCTYDYGCTLQLFSRYLSDMMIGRIIVVRFVTRTSVQTQTDIKTHDELTNQSLIEHVQENVMQCHKTSWTCICSYYNNSSYIYAIIIFL